MEATSANILLVEDDMITLIVTAKFLMEQGYAVLKAMNGEDAIRIIKEEGTRIDIILLDIDLGEGMNGIQAADAIGKLHDIPVVFLSSRTETEMIEKTDGIAAYGYVTKQSMDIKLIASIKMALKLHSANKKPVQSGDFGEG